MDLQRTDDRSALSINEAIRLSNGSRQTIYKAIRDGRLKARKFGKRTIILRADFEQFLHSLPPLELGGETR
jgi:excisionase family DNA binding protein